MAKNRRKVKGRKEVQIQIEVPIPTSQDLDELADRPFAYDQKAEIIQTKGGGKQSKLELRYDLIDAIALKRMARILDYGAKRYGEQNWRKISKRDNINRAIYHLYQHLELLDNPRKTAEEQLDNVLNGEDELGHALCRIMFSVALDK